MTTDWNSMYEDIEKVYRETYKQICDFFPVQSVHTQKKPARLFVTLEADPYRDKDWEDDTYFVGLDEDSVLEDEDDNLPVEERAFEQASFMNLEPTLCDQLDNDIRLTEQQEEITDVINILKSKGMKQYSAIPYNSDLESYSLVFGFDSKEYQNN